VLLFPKRERREGGREIGRERQRERGREGEMREVGRERERERKIKRARGGKLCGGKKKERCWGKKDKQRVR
jgi:hypothetical protein